LKDAADLQAAVARLVIRERELELELAQRARDREQVRHLRWELERKLAAAREAQP
jgi:hypothetical protein